MGNSDTNLMPAERSITFRLTNLWCNYRCPSSHSTLLNLISYSTLWMESRLLHPKPMWLSSALHPRLRFFNIFIVFVFSSPGKKTKKAMIYLTLDSNHHITFGVKNKLPLYFSSEGLNSQITLLSSWNMFQTLCIISFFFSTTSKMSKAYCGVWSLPQVWFLQKQKTSCTTEHY